MPEEPTKLDISDEMIAESEVVLVKCQMICHHGWQAQL
jgi:hypothetical protein